MQTLPYAEDDWENHKQMEVLKNMEPDLSFSMQTRQSVRERPAKKKSIIFTGTTL